MRKSSRRCPGRTADSAFHIVGACMVIVGASRFYFQDITNTGVLVSFVCPWTFRHLYSGYGPMLFNEIPRASAKSAFNRRLRRSSTRVLVKKRRGADCFLRVGRDGWQCIRDELQRFHLGERSLFCQVQLVLEDPSPLASDECPLLMGSGTSPSTGIAECIFNGCELSGLPRRVLLL